VRTSNPTRFLLLTFPLSNYIHYHPCCVTEHEREKSMEIIFGVGGGVTLIQTKECCCV
jgi:hypothetical protein